MVYLLGGWQSDFSANWAREGHEIADAFADAVLHGLERVGLEPSDIECGHVGNFVGDLFAGQGLLGGFFGLVHPDFNGMPTAEMTQQAYRGIGVPMYSSAVFCFAPDLAMGFYESYASGDEETVNRLLDGFWVPYVQLRQSGAGYAVSLVKAGVRLDGLDVGPVRAPLSEPAADHVRQLAALIETGRRLLG